MVRIEDSSNFSQLAHSLYYQAFCLVIFYLHSNMNRHLSFPFWKQSKATPRPKTKITLNLLQDDGVWFEAVFSLSQEVQAFSLMLVYLYMQQKQCIEWQNVQLNKLFGAIKTEDTTPKNLSLPLAFFSPSLPLLMRSTTLRDSIWLMCFARQITRQAEKIKPQP